MKLTFKEWGIVLNALQEQVGSRKCSLSYYSEDDDCYKQLSSEMDELKSIVNKIESVTF